jgi:transposase
MDVVVERCAGLDVHRDDVVATVRVPGAGRRRWDQQTQTFRATIGGCARRSPAASRSSITASWSPQLLAHIDTLDAAIENLHERIKLVLVPHAQIVELLCTIPGVQIHAAQVLIAECGLDMARFPTVAHFVSWAGACPGHHESAGRRRSGHTRPGPRWLTDALTECARAAVRTKDTYLAAHFAQLRGRRGEPIAIGAIRHDILVAYYHIVRDRVPFRELGPDWQRKRYSPEHRARRLQRQLEALGYTVSLQATQDIQPAA